MTKITSIIFVLAFSAASRADFTQLTPDDTGLSTIRDIVLISQEPLCPETDENGNEIQCVLNGTRANLLVHLNGCLDQLGPVASLAKEDGKTLQVYVSAVNIHNELSTRALCFAPPTMTVSVDFVDQYGTVELNVLQ